MDKDLILHLSPMFITLLVTLAYGTYMLKKSGDFPKTWRRTTLINVLLLGAASVWWFYYQNDGLSQLIGIFLYAVAAFVIGVIYTIVLSRRRKASR